MKDNKLIAEFMCAKKKKKYKSIMEAALFADEDENISLKDLESNKDIEYKYHSSWDWLMPVVEKINHMVDETNACIEICANACFIPNIDKEPNGTCVTARPTLIESVYDAVVEFIKWYNKQK